MPFTGVKLICGVLFPDDTLWKWTLKKLTSLWGEPQRLSGIFPFEHTDYYRDISPILYRRFLSFGSLRYAGDLADWKKQTCEVEQKSGEQRKVNVDPGYLDGARLVLASTKDHAHRIYLREGIFAEVTLRYRFGKWTTFDYTFPDFATDRYYSFLSAVRQDWLKDARGGGIFDRQVSDGKNG